LVEATVGRAYASDIWVGNGDLEGLPVLEVRIKAPLPLLGLLGPDRALEVVGHAPLQ
jgi:hypothetical protein